TCKVHLAADGHCRPLALLITPGQRADCTQFEPVMDRIRVPLGAGRPRRRPGSVSADKAYSSRSIRAYLRKRGISHVIPEKKDYKAARLRRGSRGGRPVGFDKELQRSEHGGACHRKAQAVPNRGDPLRQARIHLPRQCHCRCPVDMAPNL
ncbi:LOW QUALITY PROTEIN: transposase, IS4, partial [Streptomyces himastatinicus ATCC 53653]